MEDSLEILERINKSLSKVLEDDIQVSMETDLIEDEILDSLDAAMFLFEIEKWFDKKVPDTDIEELGLFKVANLVAYLQTD